MSVLAVVNTASPRMADAVRAHADPCASGGDGGSADCAAATRCHHPRDGTWDLKAACLASYLGPCHPPTDSTPFPSAAGAWGADEAAAEASSAAPTITTTTTCGTGTGTALPRFWSSPLVAVAAELATGIAAAAAQRSSSRHGPAAASAAAVHLTPPPPPAAATDAGEPDDKVEEAPPLSREASSSRSVSTGSTSTGSSVSSVGTGIVFDSHVADAVALTLLGEPSLDTVSAASSTSSITWRCLLRGVFAVFATHGDDDHHHHHDHDHDDRHSELLSPAGWRAFCRALLATLPPAQVATPPAAGAGGSSTSGLPCPAEPSPAGGVAFEPTFLAHVTALAARWHSPAASGVASVDQQEEAAVRWLCLHAVWPLACELGVHLRRATLAAAAPSSPATAAAPVVAAAVVPIPDPSTLATVRRCLACDAGPAPAAAATAAAAGGDGGGASGDAAPEPAVPTVTRLHLPPPAAAAAAPCAAAAQQHDAADNRPASRHAATHHHTHHHHRGSNQQQQPAAAAAATTARASYASVVASGVATSPQLPVNAWGVRPLPVPLSLASVDGLAGSPQPSSSGSSGGSSSGTPGSSSLRTGRGSFTGTPGGGTGTSGGQSSPSLYPADPLRRLRKLSLIDGGPGEASAGGGGGGASGSMTLGSPVAPPPPPAAAAASSGGTGNGGLTSPARGADSTGTPLTSPRTPHLQPLASSSAAGSASPLPVAGAPAAGAPRTGTPLASIPPRSGASTPAVMRARALSVDLYLPVGVTVITEPRPTPLSAVLMAAASDQRAAAAAAAAAVASGQQQQAAVAAAAPSGSSVTSPVASAAAKPAAPPLVTADDTAASAASSTSTPDAFSLSPSSPTGTGTGSGVGSGTTTTTTATAPTSTTSTSGSSFVTNTLAQRSPASVVADSSGNTTTATSGSGGIGGVRTGTTDGFAGGVTAGAAAAAAAAAAAVNGVGVVVVVSPPGGGLRPSPSSAFSSAVSHGGSGRETRASNSTGDLLAYSGTASAAVSGVASAAGSTASSSSTTLAGAAASASSSAQSLATALAAAGAAIGLSGDDPHATANAGSSVTAAVCLHGLPLEDPDATAAAGASTQPMPAAGRLVALPRALSGGPSRGPTHATHLSADSDPPSSVSSGGSSAGRAPPATAAVALVPIAGAAAAAGGGTASPVSAGTTPMHHAPSPLLPLFRGVSGGNLTPQGASGTPTASCNLTPQGGSGQLLHGSPARVATPMMASTPPPPTGSAVSGAIARSPLVERARRESTDLSSEPSTLPAWAIGAIRMTQAAAVVGSGATGVVRPGSADSGAALAAGGASPVVMGAAGSPLSDPTAIVTAAGVLRSRSASFSLPGMAAASGSFPMGGADGGRTRLRSGSTVISRTGSGTPTQLDGMNRPTSTPIRFADGGRAAGSTSGGTPVLMAAPLPQTVPLQQNGGQGQSPLLPSFDEMTAALLRGATAAAGHGTTAPIQARASRDHAAAAAIVDAASTAPTSDDDSSSSPEGSPPSSRDSEGDDLHPFASADVDAALRRASFGNRVTTVPAGASQLQLRAQPVPAPAAGSPPAVASGSPAAPGSPLTLTLRSPSGMQPLPTSAVGACGSSASRPPTAPPTPLATSRLSSTGSAMGSAGLSISLGIALSSRPRRSSDANSDRHSAASSDSSPVSTPLAAAPGGSRTGSEERVATGSALHSGTSSPGGTREPAAQSDHTALLVATRSPLVRPLLQSPGMSVVDSPSLAAAPGSNGALDDPRSCGDLAGAHPGTTTGDGSSEAANVSVSGVARPFGRSMSIDLHRPLHAQVTARAAQAAAAAVASQVSGSGCGGSPMTTLRISTPTGAADCVSVTPSAASADIAVAMPTATDARRLFMPVTPQNAAASAPAGSNAFGGGPPGCLSRGSSGGSASSRTPLAGGRPSAAAAAASAAVESAFPQLRVHRDPGLHHFPFPQGVGPNRLRLTEHAVVGVGPARTRMMAMRDESGGSATPVVGGGGGMPGRARSASEAVLVYASGSRQMSSGSLLAPSAGCSPREGVALPPSRTSGGGDPMRVERTTSGFYPPAPVAVSTLSASTIASSVGSGSPGTGSLLAARARAISMEDSTAEPPTSPFLNRGMVGRGIVARETQERVLARLLGGGNAVPTALGPSPPRCMSAPLIPRPRSSSLQPSPVDDPCTPTSLASSPSLQPPAAASSGTTPASHLAAAMPAADGHQAVVSRSAATTPAATPVAAAAPTHAQAHQGTASHSPLAAGSGRPPSRPGSSLRLMVSSSPLRPDATTTAATPPAAAITAVSLPAAASPSAIVAAAASAAPGAPAAAACPCTHHSVSSTAASSSSAAAAATTTANTVTTTAAHLPRAPCSRMTPPGDCAAPSSHDGAAARLLPPAGDANLGGRRLENVPPPPPPAASQPPSSAPATAAAAAADLSLRASCLLVLAATAATGCECRPPGRTAVSALVALYSMIAAVDASAATPDDVCNRVAACLSSHPVPPPPPPAAAADA